jgi:hypothetical protein
VMEASVEALQRETCRRFDAEFLPAAGHEKLGIAEDVRGGKLPINGLRHRPVGDTSGWYVWAGEDEPSNAPDFFVPLHIEHLDEWCPKIRKYLGLAPGWRFLIADDYEDVWFDSKLLETD